MGDNSNDNDDTPQQIVTAPTGGVSLPDPANSSGPAAASDAFSNLFWLFTGKRLDVIERRVARLEKHRNLQVVGGSAFEAEVANIRRELARTDVMVGTHLGLEIPNLPEDFWTMR